MHLAYTKNSPTQGGLHMQNVYAECTYIYERALRRLPSADAIFELDPHLLSKPAPQNRDLHDHLPMKDQYKKHFMANCQLLCLALKPNKLHAFYG